MLQIELSLDTFDLTTAAAARPNARAQDPPLTWSPRPSWPITPAWTSFGVSEHHRPDFASSAPEVVLAAIVRRSELQEGRDCRFRRSTAG